MRYLNFQQVQLAQYKEMLNEIQLDLALDDELKIQYDRTERLARIDWYLSEINRLEEAISQPHKEAFENMAKTLSDSQRIIMHRDYILNPIATSHPDFWLIKGNPDAAVLLSDFSKFGAQPIPGFEMPSGVYDARDIFFCMMAAFPLDYGQYLLWLSQSRGMQAHTPLRIGVHAYRRWSYENENPNWQDEPDDGEPGGKFRHPDLNPLVRFNCIGSLTISVNKETFEFISIEKDEPEFKGFPNISKLGQVQTIRPRNPNKE